MWPFDNAIGAGIVPQYSNVQNVILLGKMGESFDEGWLVIGNNLDEGAPATENILEDPVGEGGAGLVAEHAELRIVQYQASTLNERPPESFHDEDASGKEALVRDVVVGQGGDEHVPALGSEGGIWEALGRYRTALDEYRRCRLAPKTVGPHPTNRNPPKDVRQHLSVYEIGASLPLQPMSSNPYGHLTYLLIFLDC
ncbi:hypothetical protein HETIRDRAFT_115944 [Heterobasidion irregulare TC 32-1]|uniref:Uncharacterized protein n=1 Tax=Heterobasidion irregulare (strain TC 32-1) TaxID=747525 RepID=W4K627_HETIT|nr:uncharacterized protein HETIRDRAFT_115944 [Heterobasidion irregulare TC 32-1]ETW80775.1 hypothetical protein HETIRDRAFT_115944 [Heterobasidion irregulare TC 32-1]